MNWNDNCNKLMQSILGFLFEVRLLDVHVLKRQDGLGAINYPEPSNYERFLSIYA
jgi:hypothetical protein